MNKYLVALLIICLGIFPLAAQTTFDPLTSLDKPVPSGNDWWRTFAMGRGVVTWELWMNASVWSILGYLNNGSIGNVTEGSEYLSQLHDDASWFYERFSDPNFGVSQTEVYSMTLAQGQTGYIDAYGSSFNPDPALAYTDLYNPSTYNITVFLGRNGTYADDPYQAQISFTTNQHEYVITTYGTTTPIVLDMDGDGKLEASGGQWQIHSLPKDAKTIAFDINGDGFEELVEWVGSNDGLLMVYEENKEVTGNNLFGTAGGFLNGYEKLGLLDKNNDKQLTGEELKTLSVWQDKNGNARVEKGEVSSVEELGITEIHLTHENLVASFVQNGTKKVMWDWCPVAMTVEKRK